MDGALPSIWASLYGWFSPTVLFLLLNIVIGTIAVTSKVGGRRGEAEEGGADQPDEQRKIARTPSAIFGRLRSFKLSRQPTFEMGTATTETITHHESPTPAAAAAADAPHQEQQSQFIRSQSDAQPTAGEMPPKLPAKLKKSASAKSAFAHFEAKDMVPAPAAEEAPEDEEEEVKEVDAKADAFINRFRQQLQLQRLDSILRYKEMLHRGR